MIEKAQGIKSTERGSAKGKLIAVFFIMKPGFIMSWNAPATNIKQTMPLGYQPPKEFYSPKYETVLEKENPNPDLRTSLYWNPDVRSDSSGKAKFEFYSADTPGTYSLVIEGMTPDGLLMRKIHKISRELEY